MNQEEKHNKKTAKCQFEVYLEYLKSHNVLRMGWVMQRSHMTELNEIWEKMTKDLNDCDGPAREMPHWKKVFTEWKSHTRRKLKYHRFLSDIEKSLIDITGMTEEDVVTRKPRTKKVEPKENKEKENIDISEMQNQNFRRVITNDQKVLRKPKAMVILQEGPKFKQHQIPKVGQVKIKEEKVENEYHEQETVESESCTPQSSTSTSTSVNIESSKKEAVVLNGDVLNLKGSQPNNHFSPSPSKKPKRDFSPLPKATRDFCVQTPSLGENPFSFCRQDGFFYMGNAFLTVSRSINRYCDILEKRLV